MLSSIQKVLIHETDIFQHLAILIGILYTETLATCYKGFRNFREHYTRKISTEKNDEEINALTRITVIINSKISSLSRSHTVIYI